MRKKPKTHIVDANKELPGEAKFSLCGVFLYMPEQVDNTDPSCQKCLRAANSPRRVKRRQQNHRRLVTKAR